LIHQSGVRAFVIYHLLIELSSQHLIIIDCYAVDEVIDSDDSLVANECL
jgi:hypothetical protein